MSVDQMPRLYHNHQKQIVEKLMEMEGNVLFNDTLNAFYFTVIWRHTYGKGPLR